MVGDFSDTPNEVREAERDLEQAETRLERAIRVVERLRDQRDLAA